MITQVPHTVPGTDPAGFALALEVAQALHTPVTRAPELAPAATRRPAGRSRRRTTARAA